MSSKIKLLLLILIVCIIAGILIFASGFFNESKGFNDMGISSNHNDDWNNNNLTINRTDKFTILSSNSNSSKWYSPNDNFTNNCVIEWDNHGKSNSFDFCLISDSKMKNETPINFINNLNINKDCHVKLVIFNDTILPYVDDVAKSPLSLKTNNGDNLIFRFQINPNGADIKYSNFTIHST
ncbi:MAG: hypothetical protein E7Z80_03515 [Methanobrevibacter thaueri]|nr:hypothetical protein [Methanobrevibacter thaueri]